MIMTILSQSVIYLDCTLLQKQPCVSGSCSNSQQMFSNKNLCWQVVIYFLSTLSQYLEPLPTLGNESSQMSIDGLTLVASGLLCYLVNIVVSRCMSVFMYKQIQSPQGLLGKYKNNNKTKVLRSFWNSLFLTLEVQNNHDKMYSGLV